MERPSLREEPLDALKRSRGAAALDDALEVGATAAAEPNPEEEDEYVPLKVRRAQAEERRRLAVKRARLGDDAVSADSNATGTNASSGAAAAAPTNAYDIGPARSGVSLFEAAKQATESGLLDSTEDARRRKEEADLLAQMALVQPQSLMSAKEHAEGIRYTAPLTTDWRPPRHLRSLTAAQCDEIRAKYHILVEGVNLPPPVKAFKDLRVPPCIVAALAAKKIVRPTPIQVQGLPVAFAGRDMIGVAFTGSGKTLVFTLPLVMWALQEELRMPLTRGEGPVGVIMAPSRELARQHYDGLVHYFEALKAAGFPELRAMLAIGGEDMKTQLEPTLKGVHAVVATPGRLNDHLNKKRINLDLCRYFVLDEGDRMLDMGFDEEIKNIFTYFKAQRQTLIFSATMPKKIQDFAREALVAPVVVNVGRAGAANLDVVQEVEYVKAEAKIVYLLQCLQKTAPPVLIFAENKKDVDDIQEYLLLKGVGAVSLHGSKTQEERNEAIAAFKACTKDVLVATDVAAKGMDFPDIQHVINFDMPREIENYVHRIGRTGRCGKTGVATTFINRSVDERLLIDLKHLLMEAKQRVPPVLLALEDPGEALLLAGGSAGLGGAGGTGDNCPVCGGFHRITECPKVEAQRRQMAGPRRDMLAGSGGGW